MIPFKPLNLFTPVDQWAKVINDNNQITNNYIDTFFDASSGRIIAPVVDTFLGNPLVKGGRGEFVQMVVDNMVEKKQFINRYDVVDASDNQFVRAWTGPDASLRTPIELENTQFGYIDSIQPYYKISNDSSVAFNAVTLGQEVQIIFDSSVSSLDEYRVLLDPFKPSHFTVNAVDASTTWVKISAVNLDPSYGSTWVISEFGGTLTIV